MNKKMRVMHGMVEVAGQNSYAVRGLREIGVDAECVVYEEHPFGYPYDRALHIDKTKRSRFPLYAARLGVFCLRALGRYSVFHFHFGRSILNNMDLWLYRLFRKKVFYEFHGSDLRDQEKYCGITGMPYDPAETTDPKMHRRNARICHKATGVIIHDDELIKYLPQKRQQLFVVPLRVDIDRFEPVYPKASNEHIRIVHAPSKRAGKGTVYVLEAFENLKQRYSNIELVLVEGKTQAEAFEIYKTADIIVDQLFAGTYGVFAIESMALGKPVIACISEEMKDRLPEELPIASANKETVEQVLEELILHAEERVARGKRGREYVQKYHDYRRIAHILKGIYEGVEKPRSGRAAFARVPEITLDGERPADA